MTLLKNTEGGLGGLAARVAMGLGGLGGFVFFLVEGGRGAVWILEHLASFLFIQIRQYMVLFCKKGGGEEEGVCILASPIILFVS
jgi:hypothetical protein